MSLKNQFLVSLPNITSGSFHKSVVYLQTHNGDGAKGWIVNKQLDENTAAKLRRGMKLNLNVPVFYGGPVDINNACIIHSKDFHIPNSISLNDHMSMTRDKAIIDILNIGQYPEYWKLIVGSSSWGPGQLESEMLGSRTNGKASWTSAAFSTDLIWQTSVHEQWNKGIELSAQQMSTNLLKISNI